MKTSIIFSLLLLNLFALCAHGGEVEQFIRETLEEQRAQDKSEPNEVTQIVGDAINDSKLPEFELPKESIFTSKDKENDARYYSYDKSGKLISVEYAASPEKNEYYAYDKQGNILEKRIGNSIYKYTYDTANQLMEMESPEGKREYFYDMAGRLVMEKFNGEIDVEYKYGYLDKVIEVNRRGKITKFAYDGFGMLAQKTFHDGSTEVWVWDGLALIRRGSDIYVNEPHVSGGVPILSKTDEGVRYHEHDFLGTTLWSTDTKGNLVKDYQDTTIFGEGSIQKDRSARFTGKPYDEDLQAYVFPYRNYDASTARWRSSDPAGYPDGANQHFYAAIPTLGIDPLGCWVLIEYWSISKVFNYVDMGNSALPGMNEINEEYLESVACGMKEATSVFSGKTDENGKLYGQDVPNKGPIPEGSYYIGEQGSRHSGWYSLYGKRADGIYGYTGIPVKTSDGGIVERSGFNLHQGRRSDGCVTVRDENEWKDIEKTLNNTPTIAPFPGKPNDKYTGILIVIEK